MNNPMYYGAPMYGNQYMQPAMQDNLAYYRGGYAGQTTQPFQQQNVPQDDDDGMIWVQGESGANGYIVAPGKTVTLWDTDSQTIYLKTVDRTTRKPSTKILDYTERTPASQHRTLPLNGHETNVQNYVTIEEYNKLAVVVNTLCAKINALESPVTITEKETNNAESSL